MSARAPSETFPAYQPVRFLIRLGRLNYIGWMFGSGVVCALFFAGLYLYDETLSLGTHILFFLGAAIVLELFYVVLTVLRLNDINMSGVWALLPLAGGTLTVLWAFRFDTFAALWGAILGASLINLAFTILLCLRKGSAGDNDYGPPPPPNSFPGTLLAGFFIVSGSVLNLLLVLLWYSRW
jgi:uncharacterized membrane protein YhaH (DUF805 family)